MNICARCRDWARKPGDNLANLAGLDRRLEGDERHSTLGRIRAPDEVELPARGGKLMAPYVFGVAGPGQIHFDRRIYRHYVVVLGNHGRVIHVIDRGAFDRDVVMQEVIEGFVSHCEGEDGLSGVDFLPSIGDNPTLDQLRQCGVKHFGMNAEVLTTDQPFAFSPGYSPYTDLQASMFRNEFSNALAELSLVFLNRSRSQREQRSIFFYDGIYF